MHLKNQIKAKIKSFNKKIKSKQIRPNLNETLSNGFRKQIVRKVLWLQVPRPHHPQGLLLARPFLLNQLGRLQLTSQRDA